MATSEARERNPQQTEAYNRERLVTENMALKAENAKLRNKVVALMIKAGEL